MRTASLCAALAAAALLTPAIAGHVLAADNKAEAKPLAHTSPARSGVESGVYGFSGALKAGTSMQGVMGECIWIYDGDNKKEVAKGDCDQGNFRVPLKPGHYVVRGPGGNEKIEIKPHEWVKIRSLVKLPGEL